MLNKIRFSQSSWLIISILHLAILFLTLPSFVSSGEMFAEMATNYFPNATFSSFPTNLFATDAGYVPLFNRLVAWVISLFGPSLSSLPFVYYWVGFILASIGVSSVAHPYFRCVIPSDPLRGILALTYLLAMPIENMVFINFTYALILPISLWLLGQYVPSKKPGVWGWLFPLLMFGKPPFILFAPIAALVFLKNKDVQTRIILVLGMIMSVIQIIILRYNQASGSYNKYDYDANFIELVVAVFRGIFGSVGVYVLGPNVSHGTALAPVVLGVVLIVWFVRKKLPHMDKGPRLLFLYGALLVVLSAGLHCVAVPLNWVKESVYLGANIYRHEISVATGVLLMIVGFVSNATRAPRAILYFLLWTLASGWAYNSFKQSDFPMGFSSWQSLATEERISKDQFFIPVEPFGWFYSKGVQTHLPSREHTDFSNEYVTSLTLSHYENPHWKSLLGVMIGVKAESDVSNFKTQLQLTTDSSESIILTDARPLWSEGRFITHTLDIPLLNVTQATYTFSHPVIIWVDKTTGTPSVGLISPEREQHK